MLSKQSRDAVIRWNKENMKPIRQRYEKTQAKERRHHSIRCSPAEYTYVMAFLTFIREASKGDSDKYYLDIDTDTLTVKMIMRNELREEETICEGVLPTSI